ncbi:unnamed protein product [Somion occarium]|uniref:Conserved oligomeric Golgi complex subunit 8 n=1 Tax=Somion occarium TaxID=3059160 RepID=A0ABP1CGW6_9APHY
MAGETAPNLPLDATESSDVPSLQDLLTSPDSSINPDAIAQTAAEEYLSHLTTLSLPSLEAEPTTLASSAAQLTNALTTLCYTSYPTFLSLHTTTSTLSSSLTSLSSSLDSLLSTLPTLESSTRNFAQETRKIQKDRHKASLVLEHHDKLYDVLSLPLLLDSCVRNHNYNEALLLANHAASLAKRFPTNPLVISVREECDARMQAMLGQLLGILHEQAKLPALFRAVTFLRKMEVLDEDELALAFLTGRGVYLAGALKTTEIEKKGIDDTSDKAKESYARYLKRYIDVWREGVYDVITQFVTIFVERAPSTSNDAPNRLHALLATFATHHLEILLSLLKEVLPRVSDPSLLTSLLTQLTYCANSFARVGMDFKGLIAPIFVDAVHHAVAEELDAALDVWGTQFASNIETRKQKDTVKKPSLFLVAQSSLHSLPVPTTAQLQAFSSMPANVPPHILVSYPPLALFTNNVLTAFNGLRLLAPVELLNDLLISLDHVLAKAGSTLLHYSKEKLWRTSRQTEGDGQEVKIAMISCDIYYRVLIPFLRRALVEGVYGVAVEKIDIVAEELSKTIAEWQSFASA